MSALLTERRQKDEFFKSSPHSPLTQPQRQAFTGLAYYEPNPSLDLTVEAIEFTKKETVTMQTTTGDVRTFLKWGKFSFNVEGQSVELVLYHGPDSGHFFLPFMDATNTDATYSGGRYIDPEWLGGQQFHIDFNQSYAPYCAYNDRWSCPIPPLENRLKVRIEAGEKRLFAE